MSNASGTLVMGTAVGYGVRGVWVFLESLRRYYDGEVALLVSSRNPPAFFEYLRAKGVKPVFFDCAAWMVPDLQFSRFIRYGEALRGSDRAYERVFLTDVGDVVFQGHPFTNAPDGDLLCFMEAPGRRIADCGSNRFWVRSLFGEEMERRLGDKDISCSGTIIGAHAAILDYIDRFSSEVRKGQFLDLMDERGHDQGVHNVLLHTGALPRARVLPNGTHVYTVGYVWDKEIGNDDGRMTVAATGAIPPIVHQYNYNPRTAALVGGQYPFDEKWA